MPATARVSSPLVAVAWAAASAIAWLIATAAGAAATELLMFEDPGCGYCRRWHAEIGPGYPKSTEGRVAPLRRVEMRDGPPQGVELKRRITITPTFVLIDKGHEVGRVVGYVGAEFFYEVLGDVMSRLPEGAAIGTAGSKAPHD